MISTTLSLAALGLLGHAGHDHGLTAGLMHPLTGLDHVLAIVAVGLWSSQLSGRARLMGPLAFAAAMAAGFGLGAAGVGLPAVEPVILASVLALGLLVAWARRAPASLGLGLVALAGVAHGHAHGAEVGGAVAGYALGMLLTTAGLMAFGHVAGRLAPNRLALRLGGLGIAATGVVLMVA